VLDPLLPEEAETDPTLVLDAAVAEPIPVVADVAVAPEVLEADPDDPSSPLQPKRAARRREQARRGDRTEKCILPFDTEDRHFFQPPARSREGSVNDARTEAGRGCAAPRPKDGGAERTWASFKIRRRRGRADSLARRWEAALAGA